MRNADLDDMKDQNYKEAVAAEWKEIRDMEEKKSVTTPQEQLIESMQQTNAALLKRIERLRAALQGKVDSYSQMRQMFDVMMGEWKAEGAWTSWDEEAYLKSIEVNYQAHEALK